MRNRTSQRGSAMTEFALCGSVVILMAMAGTDIARVYSAATAVSQAAKAGAQYASYSSQNSADANGIEAAARAAAPGVNMTVTTSRACSCGSIQVTCGSTSISCSAEPSMYVVVRTSSTFEAVLPFWGSSTSMPVTGSARFRVK